MNDEQIKEVMRLGELWATYAWKACSHGADETVKSQASRAALEAYLRTIGDPENAFPLNPNGSSKWAHLQKHDGAQAIGVVFRTGSGSVGSLVDGRVVWADWLAYPNGSKSADSEYTDEDMAAVGRALMSAITQYAPKGWSPADCPSEIVGDLHNECEELRSDAERYRKLRDVDAWGEDTAPDGGSAWARLGELHGSEFDAFVDSRAESAIETPAKVSPCADQQIIDYVKGVYAFLESTSPAGFADEAFRLPPFATRAQQLFADAIQGDELGKCMGSEGQDSKDRERHEGAVAKVSPCAGHAVQRPDPLGVLSCTHPDCGRYEGPRSHECRAMADNACARPSICQGHAAQQEADALVGLRGCNRRHGGMRAVEPCGYRMRTTDPGCTGCVERDEDQHAKGDEQ